MNPRFKSTFSLLHVLVIATTIIIHSSGMIYSSSVFDQRELHQGFRMHKVGSFELQLRWQVGSGIGNRILLYKIRFSFPHPCHLNIWRRIKKFKSDWKLVLGGPGTQLGKKIWSWEQNHPHTIIALDLLGEQPWLRTLQKTNVRGNGWSRLPLMICLATVATSWHRYRATSLARPQMSGSGELKIPNEQAKASHHIHKQLSATLKS